MIQKPRHGASGSKRLGRSRKSREPGDSCINRVRVLAHKFPEPISKSLIKIAEVESILTQITESKKCVYSNADGGEFAEGLEYREMQGRLILLLRKIRAGRHAAIPRV
ncbi:MAG: hypothetical protein ACKO0V_18510, partial [bacterium]